MKMYGKGLFLFLAICLVNIEDSFQQQIEVPIPRPNEVREIGTSVIFTVQVTAASPNGIWSKDGVDIPETIPNKIYIVPSNNQRYLYVLNIQPSDAGVYMYRIGNERTSSSLAVNGVQIVTGIQDVQATAGSTATFTAVLRFENVTNGVWTKDGTPLVLDNRIVATVDRNRQILTINNVQPSDNGLYQYSIPQNAGTSATLTVSASGLFFTTGLQSQTAVIGTSATFRAVLSQPDVTGRWFRNGTQIFQDSNTLIAFSGSTHTLTITNTGPSNVGDYLFRTDGSNLESQGTLLVLYITQDLVNRNLAVQTSVVLEVELSLPGYQGTWFRGSIQLPDRTGVVVSVDNTRQLLTIPDFRQSDAGAYQFQVQGLQSTAIMQAVFITSPASDQTTVIGGTARLTVLLSVDGYTGGTWFRNNILVSALGSRFVTDTVGREQRLTIANVQSGDLNQYTYSIQTGSERSTASITLAQGVAVVRGLESQTVVIGRSATFEAVLSQSGIAGRWFRNGTELFNSAKMTIQVQGSTHSLTVTDAVPSDVGDYTFRSDNNNLVSQATLNVLYITQDITGGYVVEGDTIILGVDLSLPGYQGSWFRGNVQLPDRGGISISVTNTQHRLTITNFGAADSGLYQYQVEGLQSTANIPALFISTSASDQFTNLGNNATLTAILSLPGYTQGTWFRNGIPINNIQNRQRIETVGREQRLTIINVQSSDIAQYRYIIKTGGPQTTASLLIAGGVPVNGAYGAWGGWNFVGCDNTCGVGDDKVESRFRLCDSPAPSNGGQDCVGPSVLTRQRSCSLDACAVDGRYGPWGAWTTSSCLNTCGVGEDRIESRARRCDNPAPTPGGAPCAGLSTDVRVRSCTLNPCIVNGQFGAWSSWTISRCDNTCGDGEDKVDTRSRRCDSPEPSIGGLDCIGNTVDTRIVNCSLTPCVVDGRFGIWSTWTTNLCDNTCGDAAAKQETRFRECNNPPPSNGGQNCVGNRQEQRPRSCTFNACAVDGRFGIWTQWTTNLCDNTCGFASSKQETRFRECNNPAPSNGGQDCVGNRQEQRARSCNFNPCVVPVDGVFGIWTQWTTNLCDNTCGFATSKQETRFRECNNPAPSNGGQDCVGNRQEQRARSCNFNPCVVPVDGVFGIWTQWTTNLCDNTCGFATSKQETRFRECNNPAPSNGGQDCVGNRQEQRARSCNFNPCVVDGVFGIWTQWTTNLCDNTCGFATSKQETRFRECNNPAPSNGGQDCVGNRQEQRARSCNFNPCVVDGVFGIWTQWTTNLCDNTCGFATSKQETRFRECNNPAPSNGGQDCVGNRQEQRARSCNFNPCVVDGVFGIWTQWTTNLCDNTCGFATSKQETRFRECNNPAPSNGGQDCVGNRQEQRARSCNFNPCVVDGVFGIWTQWTTNLCDNTCGFATSKQETRFRECNNPAPSNGGQDCVGNRQEQRARSCNFNPCVVDGVFGIWTQWTTNLCDNTCGFATSKQETRFRECNNPAPSNGGQDCVGNRQEQRARSCNFNPCVVPVDGVFGIWTQWTTNLCDNTCGFATSKQETRFRECNNPAPSNGGQDCVGNRQEQRARSCNFNPCVVPVDGRFGVWTPWTTNLCDNTCGFAPSKQETRFRECNNPAPSNGGQDCVGNRQEQRARSCNFDPCVVPVTHLCSSAQNYHGIGYRYHPTECDQYIQCYRSTAGGFLGVVKSCPFSRLWNQNTFRCDEPWRVTCPMDKCAENCPSHFDRLGSCRSYWQCDNKQILTPKCCLPGFSYDPTYGCQLNPFCRDPCPTACVDGDICERRFISTNPTSYQLYGGSFGWLDGSCSAGSRFEQINCGCNPVNSTCSPDYDTDFTNPQLSTALSTWLTSSGVSFDAQNGLASFSSGSSLTSNVVMPLPGRQCSTVIRFRYREVSTATGRRILLSTSDCRKGNSFIIAVEDDKMMFELTSWYSWTTKLPVYTQGMARTEWRTVIVVYSGYDLTVSIESGNLKYIAKVEATEASIMRCGFMFGEDGNADNASMKFIGDYDSLTLYSCNPGTLF